ncbi:M23 family metallopeptidase [Treponema sp. OttesenSCG-928-L16]|nr:M23 family metallopeptidase [Treponema sp. OttesenSCG-928-L16]
MAEKKGMALKVLFGTLYLLSLAYFIIPGDRSAAPASGDEGASAQVPAEHQGMGMPYSENILVSGDDLSPETVEMLSGLPEPDAYFRPQILLYSSYKVQKGDMIGEIARNFGLNQDTLLSINNIKNSRLIQIGQVLKIPNQDGIVYTVKSGDTLGGIAAKYEVESADIQAVNELFSETVNANTSLFIPGARLASIDLQEINGDLFAWPIRGYITSPYGYRLSPFTGVRQFHTGLDIGAAHGTPIKAAMSGRVIAASYDAVSGNYVIISHHSGYRTLYAHMSVIRTKVGAYVRTGDRIGDVGSTGLSTGPHLHFTVYKNGRTVSPRSLMN